MRTRSWRVLVALVAALSLVAAACGSDDSSSDRSSGDFTTLKVPQDYKTIQEAVSAAGEGDLVLIDEGTYNEAVDVENPNITIRGVDRNKVILDGEFELENGIRAVEAKGIVVENMTAKNYLSNGFFWTGSDNYRGSYLTAYRNGDYGIYAFDSSHGQLDNSLGWGSPDAGFYIGECYPCDAVIDTVDSQYSGLGYSGTNSGGDLYIVNSNFSNNRAGIVPNSGSYELCYPSRGSVIVGNTVHDNNYTEGPGIDVSLLAQGNGILVAGAVETLVERNLVYNHDRIGIGSVPFPEEDANDVVPDRADWAKPCDENVERELAAADEIPQIVMWHPFDNIVIDNVIESSGVADLGVATLDLDGGGVTTESLNNCFSGNTFTTSAPNNLEELAPCDGEGSGGDWEAGAINLLDLMGTPADAPEKDAYKTTPEPPDQENMPGDVTAAPVLFTNPEIPDVASIKVPAKMSEG